MSTTASTLTDITLRRVRDISGVGHSRAFVRAILSDAQRFVNAALGLVITSTTLNTTPNQQIYGIAGYLTSALRVVGVREGSRDLTELRNVGDLTHLSKTWFRDIGTRFDAWTSVGRDVLIVYPAKAAASSVEVRHVKLTTILGGELTLMDLPDEYCDLVVELAVAVLLLKQRDLASAKDAIERLALRLGPDMTAERLQIATTVMGEQPEATVRK